MANNRSYLNYGDELEDQTPYSSVSSREPLEDIGVESLMDAGADEDDSDLAGLTSMITPTSAALPAQAGTPAAQAPSSTQAKIAEAIAKRQALGAGSLMDDPLFKSHLADQGSLQANLQSKIQGDFITNMGQAFSQMAQGSNTPKPTTLFENMGKQNEDNQKSIQALASQKQKIIQAIEARKSLENRAAATLAQRAADADANRTQNDTHHKESIQVRKDMIDAVNKRSDAAGKARDKRLDSMNIGRANTLLNNNTINTEITKVNAARNVQTLLDEINSGKLVGSKNIRHQLEGMITKIELGGGATVTDRANMGVDSLYSKMKDALSYLKSHPEDTIPKTYLDQIGIEGHAMGDLAAKNYRDMTNAALANADLSGGNPDVDPGQVHRLVMQKRDAQLRGWGYDPETGMRMKENAVAQPKLGPATVAKPDSRPGMVLMQIPSGRKKWIPVAERDDAIRSGAKEVR